MNDSTPKKQWRADICDFFYTGIKSVMTCLVNIKNEIVKIIFLKKLSAGIVDF